MQSFTHIYSYASQMNKDSYKKYVTGNFGEYPTIKPSCNAYSFGSIKLLTDYPTYEPTEQIYPPPPPPINNTCICKVERNKDSNVLIIVTSITSSLCVTFFFILIWYRFIFKKRLLKWKTNETNFGFGPESI